MIVQILILLILVLILAAMCIASCRGGSNSREVTGGGKGVTKNKYPFSVKYLTEAGPITDKPVVLVVPYRDNAQQDRRKHLEKFVPGIEALFKKYPTVKYHVVIAEQSEDGRRFNRGQLLNAGFKWAMERYPEAHVIFHDVDVMPRPDLFRYYLMRPDMPTHMSGSSIKYQYETIFGGILSMTPQSVRKCNGHPNNIFGWGGEDDLMRRRIFENYPTAWRPPKTAKYDEEPHDHNVENDYPRESKKKLKYNHARTWKSDGLNNLKAPELDTQKIDSHATKVTFGLR